MHRYIYDMYEETVKYGERRNVNNDVSYAIL